MLPTSLTTDQPLPCSDFDQVSERLGRLCQGRCSPAAHSRIGLGRLVGVERIRVVARGSQSRACWTSENWLGRASLELGTKPCGEFIVSPDPADVFGWTRLRPGDTFRLLVLLGQRRSLPA